MDWTKLFFSPDGRIGRQAYWIGWLVLIGVNVVLGWVPFVPLVALYCWICISAKRFHDMGKSGWLAAIPITVGFVLPFIAMFAVGGAAIVTALTGQAEETIAAAVLSAVGGAFVFLILGFVVSLGFLIWQGVAESEPGDNRYGPPAPATL